MKEIIITLVGISVSIASSISSSSYLLGTKIENHETRISNLERNDSKYNATQQELLNSLQVIKVDVAVTKNNILWMRRNNESEEFGYNQKD